MEREAAGHIAPRCYIPGGVVKMKKKMNQSTLTLILNGASIFALCIVIIFLVIQVKVSQDLDGANSDRFNLTYDANRFMNASSFLTNEVRAYTATGGKDLP